MVGRLFMTASISVSVICLFKLFICLDLILVYEYFLNKSRPQSVFGYIMLNMKTQITTRYKNNLRPPIVFAFLC